TNKSELLFFSNQCNVYKLKTQDIPDGKVSQLGEYIPGILGLENDEKIVYTVVTKDYSGNMLYTFENGKMAKVELSNYQTKTNRKKLISAYSDKSPIVDILYLETDMDVVVITENNKVICLNTSLVPLKSTKSTQGVQVIKQTKSGVKPSKVTAASESGIDDVTRYNARTIPAAAKALKGEDMQLSLL
ncbi:MAG: topoisomerase IV, partial [Candidatus Ornithomonoglobus sp.]